MNKHWLAYTGSSVIALAFASGAHAQTADGLSTPATPASTASAPDQVAAADTFGNEIIVTANKREQSINDVGLSITAETGDTLLARGIYSPTDLGKIVPGLTVQPSPFNTPVYTLRGIGFYETTLSASPTVAVYTDEVQLPFSATTRGIAFDIERVEVLKGPQGTLFGQNTTGGAINYVVNKPTDELAVGLDFEYGRFNRIDTTGFISGPLGGGLSARLAVRGVHSGPWQKSYTRDDSLGRERQLQGRFQLQYDNGGKLRLLLNANGWIDKGDTQAAQLQSDTCAVTPSAGCGSVASINFANYPKAPQKARAADWGYGIYRDVSAFNAATDYSAFDYTTRGTLSRRPKRDDRFYQLSLRADIDLSDTLTLTSITAYSDYDTDSVQDFDGTRFASVDTNTTGYIRDLNTELRIAADLDRANVIIGGNYNKAKTFDRLFYNFSQGPSADPLWPIPGAPKGQLTFNYSDQDIDAFAVFGNIEFEINDSLTLIGGARYTKTKRDFEGCTNDFAGGTAIWWNTIFGTNVQPGECLTFTANFPIQFRPALFDELDEDNISWNVGVNYKTDSDMLLYGRVSRGYKSGSFPTASVASFNGYTPVRQESVTAYEAGFKAPFANRMVEISAAAFYYDYKDKQLRGRKPDPVFGTLDGLVQIPKSRVTGVEAQIDIRPVEGLTLSVGGTYIDTEITDFTGFDAQGILRNFKGQDFPYAPALTAIGDAEYVFSIGEASTAYVGLSVTYNSEATSALANTNTQFVNADRRFLFKEYALVDLRLGVKLNDGNLRIGGFVRNLNNAYYWTNVQDNLASVTRFAGMPRTYGLQVGWRY